MANISKELLKEVNKQKDITIGYIIERDTLKRAKKEEVSGIDYVNSYINSLNGIQPNDPEYNRKLSKVLVAYNHLKTRKHVKDDKLLEGSTLAEREEMLSNAETILNGCGFNSKQLETLNKYFSNIYDLEEITEEGEEKLTDAAKERIEKEEQEKIIKEQNKQLEIEKKNQAALNKENELAKLKIKAKEQADAKCQKKVDNLIQARKDEFEKENGNVKNNVLFDADFIKRRLHIRPELYQLEKRGDNSYEDEFPSYERAKKMREECDRDAEKRSSRYDQEMNAEFRAQVYLSLRYQVENRSFLEILKNPWKAIMDSVELSRIKKSMKDAYKLTDAGLDKLYSFAQDVKNAGYGQYEVPEGFGIMNPDGTVIKTKASEKEINTTYEKLKIDAQKRAEAKDEVVKDQKLMSKLVKDTELNKQEEAKLNQQDANSQSKDLNKSQSNIQKSDF